MQLSLKLGRRPLLDSWRKERKGRIHILAPNVLKTGHWFPSASQHLNSLRHICICVPKLVLICVYFSCRVTTAAPYPSAKSPMESSDTFGSGSANDKSSCTDIALSSNHEESLCLGQPRNISFIQESPSTKLQIWSEYLIMPNVHRFVQADWCKDHTILLHSGKDSRGRDYVCYRCR